VQLPADEAPHDADVEWWYFNGHLSTEEGASYGFHYVLFQVAAPAPSRVWIAQLGFTDRAEGRFLAAEKVTVPTAEMPPQGFQFQVQGWRMGGVAGRYRLLAAIDDYSFDLSTAPLKPPVLHDGDGLVDMGAAGKSYYYSWTRLTVKGTLTKGGISKEVKGLAWMDHQWGPFQPVQVGWDWFGLQLDDGAEVMLALVRDAAGRPLKAYGTYVGPRGEVRYLEGQDLAITPLGSWTSPHTGAVYPMGWRVEVRPQGLSLTIKPLLEDSEFPGSGAIPIYYWEGEVLVQGRRQGQPVEGEGFVELVGYSRPRGTNP